jgi:hypothetical protein
MTRRELVGCLLLIALILGGRLVRHALLVDPAGGWREPGWLEERLPATPEAVAPSAVVRARLPSVPLNPNTSCVDSLCLLPGIGPALAERIVAAREAGLRFARARDLQEVRGIGPRTVERLAPYLSFPASDTASAAEPQTAR